MNDVLAEEFKALAEAWEARLEADDGTFYNILVPNVPLPAGKYLAGATPNSPVAPNMPLEHVDVLLRIHHGYPHAAPDMFWVRPHMRLPSGGFPGAAENMETYLGQVWQRFSWHLAQPWRPLAFTLKDNYMPFVLRRLREGS
jgi:hypothetical protein